MAPHEETLALADRFRDAGGLADAQRLYEQLIHEQPHAAKAWHRLAGLAQQQGQLELAADRLKQALALQPDFAEAMSDLGTVLQLQGKLDLAVACLEAAIALRPALAALHFNLGNALRLQGKTEQAVASYCRSLEIEPNFPEAYFNLGVTCNEMGLRDEAIRHYRQAIRLRPDFAAAHSNLGDVLQAQGKYDQAVALYQQAIAIAPSDPVAYNNLGNAFRLQEKFQEALACYGKALEQNPNYAEVYSNLGAVFQKLGKVDEAFACYGRALEINPRFGKALVNLGAALHEQGRLDEAYSLQCQALELDPQDPEPHINRATLLLLAGDFASGWQEYEWRWKLPKVAIRLSSQPRWEGQLLAGRTLLVHAEQGLGDTLQFMRYLPVLKQRGATILFSCPQSLHPLLRSCGGIDRLLTPSDTPPPHDFQVALLSAPRILQTTLASIPANVPYLSADPALVAVWSQRLGPKTAFRVGINWQGRGGLGAYRKRDIPLHHFGRLASIPGVQLISLQKSNGAAQELARLGIIDPGNDLDRDAGAFMDTAAIMANLDLVISSDTSIPHLAGALGVQTWLALPLVPDWRWLLARTDSPWYPTMKLFRQTQMDDWTTVFNTIETDLRQNRTNMA